MDGRDADIARRQLVLKSLDNQTLVPGFFGTVRLEYNIRNGRIAGDIESAKHEFHREDKTQGSQKPA